MSYFSVFCTREKLIRPFHNPCALIRFKCNSWISALHSGSWVDKFWFHARHTYIVTLIVAVILKPQITTFKHGFLLRSCRMSFPYFCRWIINLSVNYFFNWSTVIPRNSLAVSAILEVVVDPKVGKQASGGIDVGGAWIVKWSCITTLLSTLQPPSSIPSKLQLQPNGAMETWLARDDKACTAHHPPWYKHPTRSRSPSQRVGHLEPPPHWSRSFRRQHVPLGPPPLSSLPVRRPWTDGGPHPIRVYQARTTFGLPHWPDQSVPGNHGLVAAAPWSSIAAGLIRKKKNLCIFVIIYKLYLSLEGKFLWLNPDSIKMILNLETGNICILIASPS